MIQAMKIYWKMIGNYHRPLEITITEAGKITSTLRGCKLTLIKTVMNTGKTFTVWVIAVKKLKLLHVPQTTW